ncbi:MAG: small metal-binding protein SmbP [Methylobacter sp.]|jgi:hypothetical protein
MKKLASVCASLLLLLSTSVFAAQDHAAQALEHANQAVTHGKAGHAPVLVDHAKAALEHSLAAAIEAKGVPKTHLDAASASLQEAIDKGTLGDAESATKSAEEAVEHLKASK